MPTNKRDLIYTLIIRLENLEADPGTISRIDSLVYDLSNALLDDDESTADKLIDAAYDTIEGM